MTTILRVLKSTAFRLSLIYLVVFAVFAAVLLGFVYWQSRTMFTEQVVATVEAEARGLAERYEVDGIRGLAEIVEARSREPGGALYLLTSYAGERIAGNVAAVPRGTLSEPGIFRLPYLAGEDDREADARAAIVQIFFLPAGFRLLVGRDIEDQFNFADIILRASGFAAALVIILGIVGGYYVSRRILARIEAINDTAGRIMTGDLSERVPTAGTGDEFDRLADNLNRMLDRIDGLMVGLKNVSDNIAHDLKSPLTRLKSRAEAALRAGDDAAAHREALEAAVGEADQLMEVIRALLLIARAEAGDGVTHFEAVDAAAVLTDMADLYAPAAEEARLDLKVDAAEPVVIRADRTLFGQVVANLLDNAITHAAPDGETTVQLRLSARALSASEPPMAEIVIADGGPGIPEIDRERVLDRFVRLEQSRSRSGSGLGLSLVNAIVRLHKGKLDLEDNAPGLRVVLNVPLMSDEP